MTATHQAPNKPHGHHGGHPPEPHDPEHDIDAKNTSIWVVGSAIVLFIALYLLLPLFDVVMTTERDRKINLLPAVELQEVRAAEDKFLRGEESRAKKPIEQVMREMVK